jgi:hypothetical protein
LRLGIMKELHPDVSRERAQCFRGTTKVGTVTGQQNAVKHDARFVLTPASNRSRFFMYMSVCGDSERTGGSFRRTSFRSRGRCLTRWKCVEGWHQRISFR